MKTGTNNRRVSEAFIGGKRSNCRFSAWQIGSHASVQGVGSGFKYDIRLISSIGECF